MDQPSESCVRIMSMLDNQTPIESIYLTIECEFGVNNLHMGSTILDELLLKLESYHEFDDIDDQFYSIAELVLLMIRGGAKCARDLANNKCVNSFEYIFKCMSIDSYRFEYLSVLKHTQPQYIDQTLDQLIDIILCDRNYSNEFDPQAIAKYYHDIFQIDTPCIKGLTLLQVLTQKNLNLMSQVTELHELYKRTIALTNAVRNLYNK